VFAGMSCEQAFEAINGRLCKSNSRDELAAVHKDRCCECLTQSLLFTLQ